MTEVDKEKVLHLYVNELLGIGAIERKLKIPYIRISRFLHSKSVVRSRTLSAGLAAKRLAGVPKAVEY